MRQCINCKKQVAPYAVKYCSNACQGQWTHNQYILKWLSGDPLTISPSPNISRHILKYLLEKYYYKRARCGWNERNPVTKKSPLEVEHIDGNHQNNAEENLIILCPNCHSLTPTFRNLNKGHGRAWRMKRNMLK